MGINWVVFFAQIVNLFVLVWLLKKFLYRPIINAVEKRQAQIISKVNKAKEEYALAEAEHKKLKKKIDTFDKTKKKRFDEVAEEIEAYKKAQIAIIKKEASQERQKRQNELNRQTEMLHTQIRDLLADNFIALSHKMMGELSGETPFEQSVTLFQKNIAILSKTDIKKIKESYKKQKIISITSSDTLSEKMKENLGLFLSKTFSWEMPIKMIFEVDKSLVLGLEMTVGDIAIQWHLKTFLDEYQTKLNNTLTSMVVKE